MQELSLTHPERRTHPKKEKGKENARIFHSTFMLCTHMCVCLCSISSSLLLNCGKKGC